MSIIETMIIAAAIYYGLGAIGEGLSDVALAVERFAVDFINLIAEDEDDSD
ncbi:hypothetical protein [Bradyrhizobium sp. SZCCHNRI2010]|uniref:hypothetical protein n=1 Tax=Bradyrhizobium sp. SZCCHNRI2010 TaxID=3057283 RepID=UPI0028EB2F02|nr:hypothetical protein [Bradyrhizobium sp. SZCCHNRI2010]